MGGLFEEEPGDGAARHVPVMLNEVLSVLKPAAGQTMIDATFGAGGYSRALLDAGAHVLAIDRDPDAVKDGALMVSQASERLTLVHGEFCDLDKIAIDNGLDAVDGIVLDIGISSMQLEQAERGFSFRRDGPLDMRMSRAGVSAAEVVNHARQNDLTRIIGILGEEKNATRVSGAIVREREKSLFSSTLQLARVVEKAVGRKPGNKIHPATRTFQALRIFVNRELEQLGHALMAAERILKAGGRLVVVTFHSLEDRMVKTFFKDRSPTSAGSRHLPAITQRAASFALEGRGLLKAGKPELLKNPRARSAKLRWGLRTDAPGRAQDMSIFGLPDLAHLEIFGSRGEHVSKH